MISYSQYVPWIYTRLCFAWLCVINIDASYCISVIHFWFIDHTQSLLARFSRICYLTIVINFRSRLSSRFSTFFLLISNAHFFSNVREVASQIMVLNLPLYFIYSYKFGPNKKLIHLGNCIAKWNASLLDYRNTANVLLIIRKWVITSSQNVLTKN